MQYVLVALQYEEASIYSIFIFVISLFGCPLPWMAWAITLFASPPLHATDPVCEEYWLPYQNLCIIFSYLRKIFATVLPKPFGYFPKA